MAASTWHGQIEHMSTFTVNTEDARRDAIHDIASREMPFTIYIEAGLKRSNNQERTHRMWMKELAAQGDMEAEEYRGFNKLWFGVRLMKYQSERWAETYDRIVKPLDYQQKLQLMMEPISYPLTSRMKVKTFTQYLNDVYQYWTGGILDEEKLMNEFQLQQMKRINGMRARQNPGRFVLTKPRKNER